MPTTNIGYNLTQIANNASGLLSFTQATNNVLLDGMLGVLILIGFGVIFFNASNFVTQSPLKATAYTSFMLMGLNILLWSMSLVPSSAFFITTIGCAIAMGAIGLSEG